MLRKTLLDIAHAGVLAPSADNQHVFRVELLEDDIRLWPTPEFAAARDPLPRALGRLSMGAVVENMRLRAGELGLATRVQWSAGTGSEPIAQLNLHPSPAILVDLMAAAIPRRHTNRRMYSGPGLTREETSQLNAAVTPVAGTQLIWLQGAARQKALGLIWRAESERFLRKQLHHDIFSSIRFDLSWTDSAEWSLPPGSLEIEAPMRPFFKAARHWSLMRPLSRLGVHRLIGLRAGWLPAWQAPALGLLASSLAPEPGAIAAGTALERLWLRATLLDLALQPLAASAVLMQTSSAPNGATDSLRATLAGGWQTIAPGLTPWMVFRIGHAQTPSVSAGRLPMDAYLRDSQKI